jgi:hypothetical protein
MNTVRLIADMFVKFFVSLSIKMLVNLLFYPKEKILKKKTKKGKKKKKKKKRGHGGAPSHPHHREMEALHPSMRSGVEAPHSHFAEGMSLSHAPCVGGWRCCTHSFTWGGVVEVPHLLMQRGWHCPIPLCTEGVEALHPLYRGGEDAYPHT